MTTVVVDMRTATQGHVAVNEHAGDDLVCAAISMLTISTLNALGDAAKNVVVEGGHVEFDVEMTDSLQMGAFNVLCEGFEMISEISDRVGVTFRTPADLE